MQGEKSKQDYLSRWEGKQRRIGITGGIASGKTSIANYLSEIKGLPIIDADIYSREILKPETEVTKIIIERYGKKICLSNKNKTLTINRPALRTIIFNNTKEKKWLENLMHPLIISKIKQEILSKKFEPILIIVIPLLFELNLTSLCSEIWLLDCTLQQQITRLRQRDDIDEKTALMIINSQISLRDKKKFTDVIIKNTGYKNEWENEVNNHLNQYL